jgi:hypothetical protein
MTRFDPANIPNPLHLLIYWLDGFIKAMWPCHQAENEAERKEALARWHAWSSPFWARYKIPVEAERALADPAFAWCCQRGFIKDSTTTTIEQAANYVVLLARTHPCCAPLVYANTKDAEQKWEGQGKLLLLASTACDEMRRLAAIAGEAWVWDGRLPWETQSAVTSPPEDKTSCAVGQIHELGASPEGGPIASGQNSHTLPADPLAALIEAIRHKQLALDMMRSLDFRNVDWWDFMDNLWELWRARMPEKAAPPHPPIANRQQAHAALDDLQREVERLTIEKARSAVVDTASAANSPLDMGEKTSVIEQHSPADEPQHRFEKTGTVWHLQFGNKKTEIADTLAGLKCIAKLLEKPHSAIPALALEGHVEGALPPQQGDAPILSDHAKADYKRRLAEIEDAMKEVAEFEDCSEYLKLQQEKEAIMAEIKAAAGRAGKDRYLAAGNEARKAAERVRKAIAVALGKLISKDSEMVALADHIKTHIRKEGTDFAYRPPHPGPAWRLSA